MLEFGLAAGAWVAHPGVGFLGEGLPLFFHQNMGWAVWGLGGGVVVLAAIWGFLWLMKSRLNPYRKASDALIHEEDSPDLERAVQKKNAPDTLNLRETSEHALPLELAIQADRAQEADEDEDEHADMARILSTFFDPPSKSLKKNPSNASIPEEQVLLAGEAGVLKSDSDIQPNLLVVSLKSSEEEMEQAMLQMMEDFFSKANDYLKAEHAAQRAQIVESLKVYFLFYYQAYCLTPLDEQIAPKDLGFCVSEEMQPLENFLECLNPEKKLGLKDCLRVFNCSETAGPSLPQAQLFFFSASEASQDQWASRRMFYEALSLGVMTMFQRIVQTVEQSLKKGAGDARAMIVSPSRQPP